MQHPLDRGAVVGHDVARDDLAAGLLGEARKLRAGGVLALPPRERRGDRQHGRLHGRHLSPFARAASLGRTRVLLISGSLRAGSTNTALLRTLQAAAPSGIATALYEGIGTLPHFNPDDDAEGLPVDPRVAELRSQIGAVDALLLSTPEYAGALPGSFKNLLEWTVGNAGTYRKPIAWVNTSGPAAPTGAADAHDSLRKVLGYVGAEIVEEACARIPVARSAIGPDGLITDPAVRERAVEVLRALERHLAGDH